MRNHVNTFKFILKTVASEDKNEGEEEAKIGMMIRKLNNFKKEQVDLN